MANFIKIAPPRNSMQALLEAEPEPIEISREEEVATAIKKAKAAAQAREARVKAFLELEDLKGASSDTSSHVLAQQGHQLSQGSSASTASASAFRQNPVYKLFMLSIAGALNHLLSAQSRTSSGGRGLSIVAAAVDGAGPPLLQSLAPRIAPGSALPAVAANIFELYLIGDTVAGRAPLGCEGLLDAYMLIHFAVAAGYTFLLENMRQTLVAALSIAHKRALARQQQPQEYAAVFVARCFPSLNLQNLAATEYMLSQKLQFDMRCLDEGSERQACVKELSMMARHYEQVFVNYLRIIIRSERRMR